MLVVRIQCQGVLTTMFVRHALHGLPMNGRYSKGVYGSPHIFVETPHSSVAPPAP